MIRKIICSTQVIFVTASIFISNVALSEEMHNVPGMGSTLKTGLRDDSIALWEAFKRELNIRECMTTTGFYYQIDVAFPAIVAVNVSKQFELPDAHGIDEKMSLRGFDTGNSDYLTSLDSQSLDSYYRTLYGESAHDMAYLEKTGFLPGQRDDFATGGCYGQAQKDYPGVYHVTRKIKSEIDYETLNEFKREVGNDSVDRCQSRNSLSQQNMCEDKLRAQLQNHREKAIKKIQKKYSVALRRQEKKYENVLSKISRDSHFMEFLSVATHNVEALNTVLEIEDNDI